MTGHSGNLDQARQKNDAAIRQAPQVASEQARVRRLVVGGEVGRDAHTRALAGRLTMDRFRRKLSRLATEN